MCPLSRSIVKFCSTKRLWTVEEKTTTGNMYDLNQRYDVLAWKFEFYLMYVNLSTFLTDGNPMLNFLYFLSSRALLPYKPASDIVRRYIKFLYNMKNLYWNFQTNASTGWDGNEKSQSQLM